METESATRARTGVQLTSIVTEVAAACELHKRSASYVRLHRSQLQGIYRRVICKCVHGSTRYTRVQRNRASNVAAGYAYIHTNEYRRHASTEKELCTLVFAEIESATRTYTRERLATRFTSASYVYLHRSCANEVSNNKSKPPPPSIAFSTHRSPVAQSVGASSIWDAGGSGFGPRVRAVTMNDRMPLNVSIKICPGKGSDRERPILVLQTVIRNDANTRAAERASPSKAERGEPETRPEYISADQPRDVVQGRCGSPTSIGPSQRCGPDPPELSVIDSGESRTCKRGSARRNENRRLRREQVYLTTTRCGAPNWVSNCNRPEKERKKPRCNRERRVPTGRKVSTWHFADESYVTVRRVEDVTWVLQTYHGLKMRKAIECWDTQPARSLYLIFSLWGKRNACDSKCITTVPEAVDGDDSQLPCLWFLYAVHGLSSALNEMYKMSSISTNTCINPPLHGHPDALVNPWKILVVSQPTAIFVAEGVHIVHWGCIDKFISAGEVRAIMPRASSAPSPLTKGTELACSVLVALCVPKGLSAWLSIYSARLSTRRTEFNPRPEHFRIFAIGNRAARCRWSAVFSGISRFPGPCILGTAPFSPRFTLIGSQDLVVKSRQMISSSIPCHKTIKKIPLKCRKAKKKCVYRTAEQMKGCCGPESKKTGTFDVSLLLGRPNTAAEIPRGLQLGYVTSQEGWSPGVEGGLEDTGQKAGIMRASRLERRGRISGFLLIWPPAMTRRQWRASSSFRAAPDKMTRGGVEWFEDVTRIGNTISEHPNIAQHGFFNALPLKIHKSTQGPRSETYYSLFTQSGDVCAAHNNDVLRANKVKLDECGEQLECKYAGNVRSPRKPADQRIRPERFQRVPRKYDYVDALGRLDVYFTFSAPLHPIIWGFMDTTGLLLIYSFQPYAGKRTQNCAPIRTQNCAPIPRAVLRSPHSTGDLGMHINSVIASMRKALHWRAVLPQSRVCRYAARSVWKTAACLHFCLLVMAASESDTDKGNLVGLSGLRFCRCDLASDWLIFVGVGAVMSGCWVIFCVPRDSDLNSNENKTEREEKFGRLLTLRSREPMRVKRAQEGSSLPYDDEKTMTVAEEPGRTAEEEAACHASREGKGLRKGVLNRGACKGKYDEEKATDVSPIDTRRAIRTLHAVHRLALSGDGPFDERGSFTLIAPAPNGLKRRKLIKSYEELEATVNGLYGVTDARVCVIYPVDSYLSFALRPVPVTARINLPSSVAASTSPRDYFFPPSLHFRSEPNKTYRLSANALWRDPAPCRGFWGIYSYGRAKAIIPAANCFNRRYIPGGGEVCEGGKNHSLSRWLPSRMQGVLHPSAVPGRVGGFLRHFGDYQNPGIFAYHNEKNLVQITEFWYVWQNCLRVEVASGYQALVTEDARTPWGYETRPDASQPPRGQEGLQAAFGIEIKLNNLILVYSLVAAEISRWCRGFRGDFKVPCVGAWFPPHGEQGTLMTSGGRRVNSRRHYAVGQFKVDTAAIGSMSNKTFIRAVIMQLRAETRSTGSSFFRNRFDATLNSEVLRADEGDWGVSTEQRRNEKAGKRKSADQRYRPRHDSHTRKFECDTAFVGGVQANRSATAAPK
ncbi:hypothetical protein PR048_010612 [Dryococelus australis]|uniref:Uncharacterized protein n=1 Tax=Dryococelus australis TaxID=614101 RepID=A0ABQ9I389_9NEOP|nr:hypothetical protein PR048_010612 [Dryococelus australis]